MKTGLFSVSYAGLWGQECLPVEQFVAKAGQLGFEGVLLMAKRPHLSPLEASEQRVEAVKAALADAEIELIGLAAYTDFLLSGPAEVPIDEMQELYVGASVRVCAQLGGRVVRVFTGYDHGQAPTAAQENRVIDALRRCADRAAEHGVLLSVQNHHDLAVDTEAYSLLLEAVDRENVRAGFDAWSPHLRGEDLHTGAKKLAKRMFMTICADYRTFPRYRYQPELINYVRVQPDEAKATTMGTGEIDYGAFFRGLRDGGFDGWVLYEMCSPVIGGGSLENLDRNAQAFLEWFATV